MIRKIRIYLSVVIMIVIASSSSFSRQGTGSYENRVLSTEDCEVPGQIYKTCIVYAGKTCVRANMTWCPGWEELGGES